MFESFMQQYPGMGLAGGHNNCRNPDGDSNVWCFTGDDGSWDYCNVTRCDKEVSSKDYCNDDVEVILYPHSEMI